MPIHFSSIEVSFPLDNKPKLEEYIIQLFAKEDIIVKEINYIFCKDQFLLPMNKKYLHHDTYTDILTFDLSETENELTAEIYISIERVRDNAETFDATFEEELYRVIFHGALHLCGYNDHSEEEKKEMRQKENENIIQYLTS